MNLKSRSSSSEILMRLSSTCSVTKVPTSLSNSAAVQYCLQAVSTIEKAKR